MKRAFLLIVLSTLLVTLGFAQTPDAGSTPDAANLKGCLAGSDGNYTVTQDGTQQIFKITTSSVDLKPHLGHDVKLIGHKAGGGVSSGAADNSFAVTELNMISEHCGAAAAATTATLIPPSETVITPVQDAAAPSATASAPAAGATAPAATASAPAADAAAPSATVNPSATVASPPAVDTAAPAATVNPPAATASAPAADTDHPTRHSAHARKLSATQAAAAPAAKVAAPADAGSPAAADAATSSPSTQAVSPAAADAATAGSPSAPGTPDPAAIAPPETHRTGSLPILIAFVVLVVVLGTMIPLLGRWRKRKMLERTGSPNLSFTNEVNTNEVSPNEVNTDEASSEQEKPEPRKVA
jgi:hypothetical protein